MVVKPSPELFRNRNFAVFFIGRTTASLGASVYSFALLWDMKILTNNPLLMAFVGIAWALPRVVFSPFAGVVVDRVRKIRFMLGADLFRALLAFAVAALSFQHQLSPWQIILANFLTNSVTAAFGPASTAFLPQIVDGDQLIQANGLNQMVTPASTMLGPGISAALIAWQGMGSSFLLNGLTYILSAVMLLLIRHREVVEVKKPLTPKRMFKEMGEGWTALRSVRVLTILIPVAVLLNFVLAPIDVYLVQFVTLVLHMKQTGVAVLNMSIAAGTVIGGAALGAVSRRVTPPGLIIPLGLLLAESSLLGIPLIPWLPLDAFLAFLTGFGTTLANVITLTFMQKMIAKEYLGRVFGLVNTLFIGSIPIGMAVGGALATVVPIRILMGALGVSGTGLSLWLLSNGTIRTADHSAPSKPSVSV